MRKKRLKFKRMREMKSKSKSQEKRIDAQSEKCDCKIEPKVVKDIAGVLDEYLAPSLAQKVIDLKEELRKLRILSPILSFNWIIAKRISTSFIFWNSSISLRRDVVLSMSPSVSIKTLLAFSNWFRFSNNMIQ